MNRESGSISRIIGEIRNLKGDDLQALLGFDACIDTLVNVVSQRNEDNSSEHFVSTAQLGKFLGGLGNKSCGLELETKLSKPGGNMLITANALGILGVKTECVGTFGFPEILPVFRNISAHCTLTSVADTITALALEFDVSKVIMFDPGPYKYLDWHTIEGAVGADNLRRMASGKKLTAFLNWSEIENSTGIWKHFLKEVFSQIPHVEGRVFFTDLSDCSRKSAEQIREAMTVLSAFKEYFKVVLSLNINESQLVAKAFDIPAGLDDQTFVKKLHSSCNCDILLLHRIKDSVAFDGSGYVSCETFFCENPKILTGGGDNFNAGFCFSTFFDLDLFESLLLANAVTGFYVRNGYSPGQDDLIKFLMEKIS